MFTAPPAGHTLQQHHTPALKGTVQLKMKILSVVPNRLLTTKGETVIKQLID